jgi:hypothetical protein
VNIGLLMINGENDVLDRTLDANSRFVDAFYVLDGTTPNDTSRRICESHGKCWGYIADQDLPRPRFPDRPVDGYRQAIYELAIADHGHDNWFLLLHGDEVWTGMPGPADRFIHDGFNFPLPFFFPRDGEPWDYNVHPLDQLRWNLGPGYPEMRMFRGSKDVRFLESQHFNVTPTGLNNVGWCDYPIRHYLYRSPEAQRARAAQHQASGFDPDNYQHITDGQAVYWTDDMIDERQQQSFFRDLAYV